MTYTPHPLKYTQLYTLYTNYLRLPQKNIVNVNT